MYLNLCDLALKYSNDTLYSKILKLEKKGNIEMIYIGSYFCGQYFLKIPQKIIMSCLNIAKMRNIKIRMVLPIFTEKLLHKGKENIDMIASILGNYLDAMVVNDLGMLDYVSSNYNIKIIMGRLLSKDTRDQRIQELCDVVKTPDSVRNQYLLLKQKFNNIIGYEIENIYSEMEEDNTVTVHVPYVYQTVGQICCYANIMKDDYIFKANRECSIDCMKSVLVYNNSGFKYIRLGRAILYKKEQKIENNLKQIYLPLEEFLNEDFSAVEK